MTQARQIFGRFSWVDDQLVRFERALIFGLIIFLVVVQTAQVLSRYVFNAPLDYTTEASRFGLVWLVFIGAAHATYLNEHFVVQMLVDSIKFPGKSAYLIFIDLVVILFFVGLMYYGAKLAWRNPRIAPVLGISFGWAYLAMPVGSALMIYHMVVALVRVRVFGEHTYPTYDSDLDRVPADETRQLEGEN